MKLARSLASSTALLSVLTALPATAQTVLPPVSHPAVRDAVERIRADNA